MVLVVADLVKVVADFKQVPAVSRVLLNQHKIIVQECKSHNFIKFHFLRVVVPWEEAADLVKEEAAEGEGGWWLKKVESIFPGEPPTKRRRPNRISRRTIERRSSREGSRGGAGLGE